MLARVLTRQHVRAVYQPIRDLRDGVIAGYEALARPADVADDASVVDFFRAARQDGQIRDLEWLCRRAALDGAKGVDGPFLSLNLDPDVLDATRGDAEALGQLLDGAGRDPATVVVEATRPESLGVERLLTLLLPYKDLGVRVALAGVDVEEQRQLETASRQPDIVKLARAATAGLDDPERQRLAARALERAADGGPIPIAEGIEREETAARLLDMGFGLGQGYLLGRPGGLDREGHPVPVPVAAPSNG